MTKHQAQNVGRALCQGGPYRLIPPPEHLVEGSWLVLIPLNEPDAQFLLVTSGEIHVIPGDYREFEQDWPDSGRRHLYWETGFPDI